jgi:hypothetical protein
MSFIAISVGILAVAATTILRLVSSLALVTSRFSYPAPNLNADPMVLAQLRRM